MVHHSSELPPIMDRLRADTRPLHDQVEALPFSAALMAETLPLPLYVGQLTAYLPVHRALESQIDHHQQHPAIQAVWQPDMYRTPLLQADLAHFTVDIPTAPVQRATADFVHTIDRAAEMPVMLLGMVYVFEGSTLGARLLLPHLQSAYGLNTQGVQYYQAYGEEVNAHWKVFRARMNAAVTTPSDHSLVLDGAKATFQHIQHLFTALWKSA